MNAKGILEQLMKQAGNQHDGASGQRGLDARKLVGSSALSMLIGTKRGRKVGGKGLKYAALAGVGKLAWEAWQRRQASTMDTAQAAKVEGEPFERMRGGEAQERRSLAILKAMIAAARADGHVDDTERAQLTEHIDALGADAELHAWVERQMRMPLNANEIARDADSPQAAREMYLASAAIIDDQNPMERAWLDQLAAALGLERGVAQELERQVAAAS